jgi:LCP family protein required for cell wall assembly
MRLAGLRHSPAVSIAAPAARARYILAWTVLGTLVPGLGYLRAGRTLLGRVVLAVTLVMIGTAVGAALVADPVRFAESVAVSPVKLTWTAAVAVVLAGLWGVLVLTTHVAVRRSAALPLAPSIACAVLVVVLVAVGALPATATAVSAMIARQTLLDVFTSNARPSLSPVQQPARNAPEVPPSAGRPPADPWAAVPRVNVLLIGSDADADRAGVRPDTLVVASIDTATGRTVLFSLPRNLQRVPFPAGSPAARAYPQGFRCINPANGVNTECLLNGIWTFAEAHAGDYYAGVRNPGLTATIQAAESVTGLRIGHYVLVDLKGFREVVDAIGGLRVNVRERLPIGGTVENPAATIGWIEPGLQTLDGWHALWYARSRWSTDDFDRMRRQRCVLGALAKQADPATLADNFPAIARAARRNIRTDIALDDLTAWVELARRVQGASVTSLPFTADVIDTVNPDFTRVHALVQQALAHSSSPSAVSSSPGRGGRPPGSSSGGAGAKAPAADVGSVC